MEFEPTTLKLKANYLNTMGTVVVVISTLICGLVISVALGMLADSSAGAFVAGGILGAAIGAALGYMKAFNMKVRGQTILLDLEVEEHTRKMLNNLRLLNERIEELRR